MREPRLVVLGLWLAVAQQGQASSPALQPVKLAFPEDAIRSTTNLVAVHLHTPPPLATTLHESAERPPRNSRDWINRAPESYGSTPVPPPMLDASEPSQKSHSFLDPDQEMQRTPNRTTGTATEPGRDLGQKWGWLAGTVVRMEGSKRNESARSSGAPWESLSDEDDTLDADDTRLDADFRLQRPFDNSHPDGKRVDRWTGLDLEPRTTRSAPGMPASSAIEMDAGFPDLSDTKDER